MESTRIIEKLIEINEHNADISRTQTEAMTSLTHEIKTLNKSLTNGTMGEVKSRLGDIYKQNISTIVILACLLVSIGLALMK